MPERKETPATPLGIYDRSGKDRITGIELTALILSALWLLGAAVFCVVLEPGSATPDTGGALRFIMVMLAVFMPVAMIWVAATAARASKVMREESQRLQAAIDAIRQAYVAQNQTRHTMTEPTVARKLDEIAAAQRKAETALAMFSSTRHAELAQAAAKAPPEPQVTDDQVALPFGTTAEEMQPPLDRSDFIRALH